MTAINIYVRSWMFFALRPFSVIEYAITFTKAMQHTSPHQKSVKVSKSTVPHIHYTAASKLL